MHTVLRWRKKRGGYCAPRTQSLVIGGAGVGARASPILSPEAACGDSPTLGEQLELSAESVELVRWGFLSGLCLHCMGGQGFVKSGSSGVRGGFERGSRDSHLNQHLTAASPQGDTESVPRIAHKVHLRLDIPDYWKSDILPEAMRHASGHDGSHTFLTAEFINALVEDREPVIDVYESLAMTAPGLSRISPLSRAASNSPCPVSTPRSLSRGAPTCRGLTLILLT